MEYIHAYDEKCSEKGTQLEDTVRIMGRVYSIRKASAKLLFIDIRGEGKKVQIIVNAQNYLSPNDIDALDFKDSMLRLRRGDIVGV